MKGKLPLSILICFLMTFSIKAQTSDTSSIQKRVWNPPSDSMVSFITYWSKKDTFRYDITKVQDFFENDSIIGSNKYANKGIMYVIDSTKENYELSWNYLPKPRKALSEIIGNDNIVDYIKNGGLSFIYEISKYGEIVKLTNLEKIQDRAVDIINQYKEVPYLKKNKKVAERFDQKYIYNSILPELYKDMIIFIFYTE